eukprot:TRINITY_DN1549_c0_g1_i5.p1 TRINITY_DN1549_c0_g1~~TRINITY_DN1549_c0_g1_i5.p1  ORF type:complete len:145 (-),score=34.45 TRINITY_DN1549_c0_g1_i5:340-774(-)
MIVLNGFNTEKVAELIKKEGVTFLNLVPPAVVKILNQSPPLPPDLFADVQMISCSAAPLGREHTLAFLNRFAKPLFQSYGMTEASPTTHLIPPGFLETEEGKRSTSTTVGVLIPNMTAKIVDENGKGSIGFFSVSSFSHQTIIN